jgi:hypothetical protein
MQSPYITSHNNPLPPSLSKRKDTWNLSPLAHIITVAEMSPSIEVRNMLWRYDNDPRNQSVNRCARTEMALEMLYLLFTTSRNIACADFATLGELVLDQDMASYCFLVKNKHSFVRINVFFLFFFLPQS